MTRRVMMKTAIRSLVALAASLLGLVVPRAADAASIPTSYTLTDLGPMSPGDDGLGTGLLHASDGRSFVFSWTNNRIPYEAEANLLTPSISYLTSGNSSPAREL